MYVFYLETDQKLSVSSTVIVTGTHISRQFQVNNNLRSTTDVANQFSCRHFMFSDFRKDLQLVYQNNYYYSITST